MGGGLIASDAAPITAAGQLGSAIGSSSGGYDPVTDTYTTPPSSLADRLTNAGRNFWNWVFSDGADSGTQSETAPTVPDAPEGKVTVPSDKFWKDKGIDPHEVKDYDSTRNLGFDKKGNVWSVDRKGSGNPQWEGTIDSLKQK